MFDFLDVLTVGKIIKAHGEEWIAIKYIKDSQYLAVKNNTQYPGQVFLIKEDNKEDE